MSSESSSPAALFSSPASTSNRLTITPSFEHTVPILTTNTMSNVPNAAGSEKPAATFGIDKFDKTDRARFLSVIDKFRELGVTRDISLPQLVVVGDQSSGKSSLLEGITELAFPVAGDVCTRFATQLVLRRSPAHEASGKVSIIPGPSSASNESAKQHLDSFQRTIDAASFDGRDLGKILNEASIHMGLPDVGTKVDEQQTPEKRFSDDIVSIELSGPKQSHLSVVDVPGLFHNPTKLQTDEDKTVIRNLVKKYVGEKRTIVLAVCNALSNLANQEVFQLTRDADPDGQRTVGVITKCDVVAEGDEHTVLEIAMNRYEPLKHGWFVVKNRSTKDINDGVNIDERHNNERNFFDNTAPWNTISPARRGAGHLQDYLANLLSDHIRSELPGLLRELRGVRENELRKLQQLGDSRQNSAEQRRYLGDIAAHYEKRVQDALVNRSDSVARNWPPLKLRKHLRDLDDKFAEKMHTEGHTYVFRTTDDYIDKEYAQGKREDEDEVDCGDNNIYNWIRGLYLEHRGVELPGMVNPDIVRTVFQLQTDAWEGIAVNYFEEVMSTIQEFNECVFEVIISDNDVRRRIQAHLETHAETPAKKARERLMQLLADERDNILKTVNDYYTQTLNECRMERLRTRMELSSFKTDKGESHINLAEAMSAAALSNEDEAVNNIHDALKAYYKVSIKRFTDNVIVGPVESDLLGEHGLVKTLNHRFVNELSDDQLKDIAQETPATSAARADAAANAERMQKALDMAKGMGV